MKASPSPRDSKKERHHAITGTAEVASNKKQEASGEKISTAPQSVPAAEPIQDLRTMIEVEAYCIAERRGFVPGMELEDWLEAERAVIGRLGLAGKAGLPKH